MQPGETDADKKTVSLDIYNSSGLPASGEVGEGAVATVSAGDLQISYDYGASYANALGTFSHGGDGNYRYRFDDTEVQTSVGEKNIWLRYKKTGFRTRVLEVQLRYDTDRIASLIGTPADTTVSNDIADVKSDTSLLPAAMPKIDDLYQIGIGRWKIQGTQLLLYGPDNETVIFAFNLKDDAGEDSSTKVFERVPVP